MMNLHAKATHAAVRPSLLAAVAAFCLAVPVSGARALDCGPPLAVQDCQGDADRAGCGLLYLRIANLVEDGPVLHGLSLAPDGPVGGPRDGLAPGRCTAGAGQSLPPADAGGPEQDCIAYLLPACSYGIQARFGDGSRAAVDALEVDALEIGPSAAGDTAPGRCTTVTVDLGRRAVTAAAADCDDAQATAGMATANDPGMTVADPAGIAVTLAEGLQDAGVTAVTSIIAAKREP